MLKSNAVMAWQRKLCFVMAAFFIWDDRSVLDWEAVWLFQLSPGSKSGAEELANSSGVIVWLLGESLGRVISQNCCSFEAAKSFVVAFKVLSSCVVQKTPS